VTRRGRFWLVAGRSVELFPVAVMAEAVERRAAVVRLWEREGRFPKPMYRVPGGHAAHRRYSAEQVANANALYRALKVPRQPGSQGAAQLATFLRALQLIWYRVGVTVDPDTGRIIESQLRLGGEHGAHGGEEGGQGEEPRGGVRGGGGGDPRV
jgi:hypothetical protein